MEPRWRRLLTVWLDDRPMPAWAVSLLVTVYAVVVAFAEWHHEPWRDEADCWLLARDAGFFAFWHRLALGGSPGLWPMMLVPLARLGLPYASQAVLHLAIATVTAALVLRSAPFPWLTRIALVFSYYFAYEYAVLARNYALGVLLLLALAALYESRYDRPLRWCVLVALLANTSTHALIVAMVIGAVYLLEGWTSARSQMLRGVAVMIAGGLAAVAQLWPHADASAKGLFIRFTPNAAGMASGAAFFPIFLSPLAAFGGAILIIAALLALRRDRTPLLVLCLSYAGLAYLFTFIWIGGLRHTGWVLLVLVYALWTAGRSHGREVAVALLTLSLFFSVAAFVKMARLDLHFAFSGAEELAGFLREQHLETLPIAAHSQATTSAVAPYLAHPLWYAGIRQYGTFILWDKATDRGINVPYPVAVAAAGRQFAGRDYLLLLNVRMPDPAARGFALIHETPGIIIGAKDERFWLYRPLNPSLRRD